MNSTPTTAPVAPASEVAARAPQPLIGLDTLRSDADKAFTRTDFNAVYPKFGDDALRRKAKLMFFRDNMQLEDIASEISVPINTVIAWAHVEDWVKRKALEVKTLKAEERMRMDRIRIGNRTRIVQEQLETSAALREKLSDMIEEAETPSGIKLVAEAAKNIADTETRALGIADNGHMDDTDESEAARQGKQPLVVVFSGSSGLPPIRRHDEDVIDVLSEQNP